MKGRKTKVASLIAWIRLNPTGDGYGIPLFKGPGNAQLTPETGGDLKIVCFTEFYNEDGYSISYRLPTGYERRRYRIGDFVPIPFIVGDEMRVVDSDTSSESFVLSLGELGVSKTARGIATILQSAADGTSSKAIARRVTARFRIEHDEVLSGEPAHSSYWLQRLGVAIAASRLVPNDGQKEAGDLILEKARSWLQRFSGSGDFMMLQRLIRQVQDLGKNADGVRDLVFVATLRRLTTGDRPSREVKQLMHLSHSWIPDGLFAHYVRLGSPAGLLDSDVTYLRDFPSILIRAIDHDLDKQSSSLDRSLAIAAILYADRELPSQLEEYVSHLARGRNRDLQEKANTLNRRSRTYTGSSISSREAEALLRENDRVIALYRISNGSFRLEFDVNNRRRRFGLSQGYVDLLNETCRLNRSRKKR